LAEKILTINNLEKHFLINQGIVKAVNGVDLCINKKEILGLVGESGSGKSTLGFCIVNIHKISKGEICSYISGKECISKEKTLWSSKIKRKIQIVFQNPDSSLNPAHTIKAILEFPLIIHKITKNKRETQKKLKEILNMVQLPIEYLYKKPNMLSGGEKQIISIARSLASSPNLLILDEPTSSLDVSMQAKIIQLLKDLQKELDLSFLFISHNLSLVRNIAHNLAIMYLGKICEIASAKMIFDSPLHPYTQMLLSSIPVISEEEEKFKPKKIISNGEIPSPINIPNGCAFHSRCPKAMDICHTKEPDLVNVEEGHFVRCHLYSRQF